MAFNAKNLTYDKSEPAFLQRLKAGYAAQDGRSNIQHARSGKSRLKMGDGDEDDGPVILDESGEIVEKGVYEGMMNGERIEDQAEKRKDGGDGLVNKDEQGQAAARKLDDNANEVVPKSEKQTEAAIGAVRKRKAVKVVGITDEDGADNKPSDKFNDVIGKQDEGNDKITKKAGLEKPKKKAKKIKLSFDEPE